MKKRYNILVFPGGTEIGLEIQKALCYCKDIRLYSAGDDVSSHAPFIFRQHFSIPSVDKPDWIVSLNKLIEELKIDYIFPAHDDVILALAQNSKRIKCRIVSSPLQTCLIARYKSRTYRLFTDTLPIPKIYEDLDKIDNYPVFAKPDRGQGSQHTYLLHSKNQLLFLDGKRGYVVTEYLPGDEYTVDCFSDRVNGLLFCAGRQRIRVASGISMSSCPVNDTIFVDYANKIKNKLTFHGAWFFQLKKDQHGNYKLLEIAPRIAGTMAMHRVYGINFPLLSIYEQERVPIEILPNKYDVVIDRALVNRYKHNLNYDVVYVDLDDTLIIDGMVNTKLISFLFQCLNRGIRIELITKHQTDIDNTLKKYRLTGIFDNTIHIKQPYSKADYISGSNAILIDDSFSERKSVFDRHGIPTFDNSMIELLIELLYDERV